MKRLYLVALALLLSGCGGDPPPAAPPPPSPVRTTPAAPVMPEGAKEDSKEGAIAFVRHYVQLLNYAQSTGDTGPLVELSGIGCKSCTRVRNAIGEIYTAGGRIKGGEIELKIDLAFAKPDLNGWSIYGVVRFAPSTVYKREHPPQQLKGGSGPVTYYVRLAERGPQMIRWTRES